MERVSGGRLDRIGGGWLVKGNESSMLFLSWHRHTDGEVGREDR